MIWLFSSSLFLNTHLVPITFFSIDLGTKVHGYFFSIWSISSFIALYHSSSSSAYFTLLGSTFLSRHDSFLSLFLVIGLASLSPIICSAGWCHLTYLDNLGSFLASMFGLSASESLCTSLSGSSTSLPCVLISETECPLSSFYNLASECSLAFIGCDSTDIETCCWFLTWLVASSLVGIPS